MPDRKYENNEQELMGKERKALKSSLLPVRALLDSGSDSASLFPQLAAVQSLRGTMLGNYPPLLQLALPLQLEVWSS